MARATSLPPEVWEKIADYLEYIDYSNFRLTCKRFYEFTVNDVWSNLYHGPFLTPIGIRTSKCRCVPWLEWEEHTCLKRVMAVPRFVIDEMQQLPRRRDLLSRVKNMTLPATDIPICQLLNRDLVNLKNLTIDGVLSLGLLEYLRVHYTQVPKIYLKGFVRISDLFNKPSLCSRITMLTVDTYSIKQEPRHMVETVARSLVNLKGFRLHEWFGVASPLRKIMVNDIVFLVKNLSTLKYISLQGPIYNPLAVDWIPDTVEEFRMKINESPDSELKHHVTSNRAENVRRLELVLGKIEESSEITYKFHFPSLQHLDIFIGNQRHPRCAWVEEFLEAHSNSLLSLKIEEFGIGFEFLKWFKGSSQLESLIVQSSIRHYEQICEMELPNLEFLFLSIIMLTQEVDRSPDDVVYGIISHCRHLGSFWVDRVTFETLNTSLGFTLQGEKCSMDRIFDNFQVCHRLYPANHEGLIFYRISVPSFLACRSSRFDLKKLKSYIPLVEL